MSPSVAEGPSAVFRVSVTGLLWFSPGPWGRKACLLAPRLGAGTILLFERAGGKGKTSVGM